MSLKLRRLNGYQGIAAGMSLPSGIPIVVLAESESALAQAFEAVCKRPASHFLREKSRKAIIVVPELEEQ